MANKQQEQREPDAPHPALAPAFSCRRWSRLTGRMVSPIDARAWRKRSQQRARTAPDYFDRGRESALPARLLRASPRPAEGAAPSGLMPLRADRMGVLVERVYGSRTLPLERNQQQRKQRTDAVKDAIYLPAVTSRWMPPLPRGDRSAWQPKCEPSPTSGEWIQSATFLPPPGIKLLSTELPELRARLARYQESAVRQDQSVLFFRPTPPPPENTPPSSGQKSPGSKETCQNNRSASQQCQWHHRKLKNRDGSQAACAPTIGATSTGSLESVILGALEAREMAEPTRCFLHSKEGENRTDSKAGAGSNATLSTLPRPNDLGQELGVHVTIEQQAPPIAAEFELEEAERSVAQTSTADVLQRSNFSDSLSHAVLGASDIPQDGQDRHDSVKDVEDVRASETPLDRVPVECDDKGHADSDSGYVVVLNPSAESAVEVHDPNEADSVSQRHTMDGSTPTSAPTASIASSAVLACAEDVLEITSNDECDGERHEVTEAMSAPQVTAQLLKAMGTVADSIVSIGDFDIGNTADDGKAYAQEEPKSDGMIGGMAHVPVDGVLVEDPEKQLQLEDTVAACETSSIQPGATVARLVHESEEDDYSDEDGDDDWDSAATAIDDELGLNHAPTPPAELEQASGRRNDTSRPSSAEQPSDNAGLGESELIVEAAISRATSQEVDATSSSRRPSTSTYDADFEDEGEDEDDDELEYYDSDEEPGNED